MKLALLVATLLAAFLGSSAAHAYKGLEQDYKTCTEGGGKVSDDKVFAACSRLIDNAAEKNEAVGFFHALRAEASKDPASICADANEAARLLKDADLIAMARKLAEKNCNSADAGANTDAPQANTCLTANETEQPAEGRLSLGNFKDGAGRKETAFILTVPAPVCLNAEDADERVESSQTIHVFSSDDAVHATLQGYVGKAVLVRGNPMPAMTVHHHAPIIMDITEIDEP